MKFFIDIETIPSQKKGVLEEIRKTIKHPGNISKPETIEKWYAENADAVANEEWRKQSFDGLFGEVISIAWAFDDESPDVLYRQQGEEESKLLSVFFKEIDHQLKSVSGKPDVISQWIGHYITGFDLRFLWQRCVVNDVKPSVDIPYDAKPWGANVFDTKIAWSGSGQYSGKSSLDTLCKGFGFDGKGDLDGSKIFDYWLNGRYDEIAEYNKDDVNKCRLIYKKLNFIGVSA